MPAKLTSEQAYKIARHHLGDALTSLARGGPTGDDWIAIACHGATEVSARASTVEKAARDAADQLRAAGWVPTHPRLEWEQSRDAFNLVLQIESVRSPLWSGKIYADGTGWARNDNQHWPYNIHSIPKADFLRVITGWCTTNLPSLHLPPFPETPDDSV